MSVYELSRALIGGIKEVSCWYKFCRLSVFVNVRLMFFIGQSLSVSVILDTKYSL